MTHMRSSCSWSARTSELWCRIAFGVKKTHRTSSHHTKLLHTTTVIQPMVKLHIDFNNTEDVAELFTFR